MPGNKIRFFYFKNVCVTFGNVFNRKKHPYETDSIFLHLKELGLFLIQVSCAGIASNCFSLLKPKFTSVFSTFPPIFRNLKLPKRQNCVRFNLGNWIFQKIDTWYLMVERRYGHFSLQLRNIDGSNSIRHLNETVSPFSYTLNDRGSVLDGSSLQLLIVLSLDMRCTPGNWSGDSEAQYNRNTCSLVFSGVLQLHRPSS